MTGTALLVLATLTAAQIVEITMFVLRPTFMRGMSVGAKPYSNGN
jgi:hypothetical protein